MRIQRRSMLLALFLALTTTGAAARPQAAACGDPAWCLGGITREGVTSAWSAVATWDASEVGRGYRTSPGLSALPLDGTVLLPIAAGWSDSEQRYTNIYGRSKILYALRRAAVFLQRLEPRQRDLTVLRVDTDFPLQAHAPASAGSDVHVNGRAADLAYPLVGTGSETSIDFAATFWLVYALSKTPGVAGVILDYRDEVAAYGHLALAQGVISDAELQALLRVARADKFRNHDTHMHIDAES